MTDLSLRSTRFHRLLRRVQRPWAQYVERKALGRDTEFAGQLLDMLRHDGQVDFGGATPRVVRAVRTRSDVIVMLIGSTTSSEPAMVLKLPLSREAEQSTAAHRKVVLALHQTPNLEPFCALVPKSLAWGEYHGRPYYLETALAGEVAGDLVRRRSEPATLLADAARTIGLLHRATAQLEIVDEALFERIAGDDLNLLRSLTPHWPEAQALVRKLNACEALLREAFVGRSLPFAWAHGDYWPGNILISRSSGALSGIVDWDRASAQQLPALDILHLLAYTRKMRRHTELGEEVVGYLLPAALSPAERALIEEAFDRLGLPRDADFFKASALLYWLRFAATNLSRYPAFQSDRIWMRDNVFLVLKRGLS